MNRCKHLLLLFGFLLTLSACAAPEGAVASLGDILPEDFRAETPWVELNGNQPEFTQEELTTQAFETYSPLDRLGRCGVAYANLCPELMPTQEREEIGQVKPAGWHTVKYDGVDGKYLYNRCHLIGFQLAGENANEENLITGTRYLNVEGMLPFENQVADYIKETGNHVLYRVTPVYRGDDLVCWGVRMEGYSVEDQGAGISFHVFCFNAQPGVAIDYATGDSWADQTVGTAPGSTTSRQDSGILTAYVLNTNTQKFHLPDCDSAAQTSAKNKKEVTAAREDLVAQGYAPCSRCQP